MRIRPLIYFFLVVLAVFFLPTNAFANNENLPEKAASQVDAEKESSNPVAEETLEQGEQISQEVTGKEKQSNSESENTEPVSKNKVSTTLPPQVTDQATGQTDKLERELTSKKKAVQKQVEAELSGKKGKLKNLADKNSKNNKVQNTQTNTKDEKPENEKKPMNGKEVLQTSVTDSGEKIVRKNNNQYTSVDDNNLDKQEHGEQPLSIPEPKKDPNAQGLIMKAVSLPSPTPVNTSGGDLGSQTSFSLLVKGNLPGFLMFFSESQIIGTRSELLRDQWVNAPPAEPPKVAS